MSTLELENIKHPDNSGNNIALNSNGSMVVDRQSTDGTIIDFRKSGTTVGSIGTSANRTSIGSGSNASGVRFDGSGLTPFYNNTEADGTVDLGYSAGRFRNIYLSGGVYLGGLVGANRLDDYEEGTWTPVPASSTLTSYQTAWYTKIGNTVTCSCYVYSFGDTTSSTPFTLTGLPFTHKSSNEAFFVVPASGGVGNLPSGTMGINARIGQNGGNGISFYYMNPNTTGGSTLLHSHLGAFHLQFTFTYITT